MFDIVLSIIGAVFSLAGAILGPKIYQLLATRLSASTADLLTNLAAVAVQMTEQQLEGQPGSQKKAAAVAALQGLANSHSLKLTEANIHAAIESAVYQLKQPASAPAPAVNQPAPTN